MEKSHYSRWHRENPKNLQELQEYLCGNFGVSFREVCIQEIRQALNLMKARSPDVLSSPWSDHFSTIFINFHTGQPFMQTMLKTYVFPEKLKQFLDVCTILEKTTDQFAYLYDIEELQHAEEITKNLETLLQIMPTQEQFVRLVQEIKARA